MYRKFGKRVLDVTLALIAFVVFGWVFAIVAFLVKRKLGSPVIFSQGRPGKDGKIFTMYKFRTMTDEKDKNGNLLPDEQRLPRFGKLLRSSSLDELPAILNVLKGEMSFVGPRPLATIYLERYNKTQKRRHEVYPGITGLAQVNGRNAISWEQKFEYDVYYVDNYDLLMDLKILFLTIKKVFIRDGVLAEGRSAIEDFKGSNES